MLASSPCRLCSSTSYAGSPPPTLAIGWPAGAHPRRLVPNYSVKWTAAAVHGNLTRTVAAATYLKR